MALSFEEAFRLFSQLEGKEIEIQGRVIVAYGEKSFVASDYEGYMRGESLPLDDDKRIAQQLSRRFDPLGGGACIYNEEVLIAGTVRRDKSGFCLTGLRYCEVRRDGVKEIIGLKSATD